MGDKLKEIIERNMELKTSHVLIILSVIFLIGLILRLYYLPYDLPIIGDGLAYFSYAYEMSEIGTFPPNWPLANNGWPAILSIFFSMYNGETFLENIQTQRIITVLVSSITIIPIFFICNRFFNKTFSIIGASIFIFEPRIILNSTTGLIEPIYILILSMILAFYLKNDKNTIYVAFFLAGVFAILRWEGLLLIFGLIGLYFIENRHKKHVFRRLSIAIVLFLLVIIPISYVNFENTGKDGLISPLIMYGPGYVALWIEEDECPQGERMQKDEVGMDCYPIDDFVKPEDSRNIISHLAKNGIENTLRFFGWAMIPSFIVFFPISIILLVRKKLIKNWDHRKIVILVFGIILFLPAGYAFTRDFEDIRYLYTLFPIFSLVSLVFIKRITENSSQQKIILILILLGVVISSVIFLEIKLSGNDESEKERYEISKFLVKNADGVNFSSFTKYFKAAEIDIKWPYIPPPNIGGHLTLETKKINIDDNLTLNDILIQNKDNGLTHIVTEGITENKILQEIFHNYERYPFLEKVYDNTSNSMFNKVKIFKINYDILKDKLG